MVRLRARSWCGDRGGTAVEYVLIMGVIALAIALAAIALGAVVDNPFTSSADCVGDIGECPK